MTTAIAEINANRPASSSTTPRRLFLVGCPRSGTTLVQGVLAAHREIITFQESHFFDKGFRPTWLSGYKLAPERVELLRSFLDENEIGDSRQRERWLADFARTTSVTSAATYLIHLLDEQATGKGRGMWMEKTPDHVWRIPLLQLVAPDAQFVHIVRSPLPTVSSLRLASGTWGKQRSWLHCLAHWRTSLSYSLRYCGHPAHYMLFYEDFVAAPEAEAARLLAWLRLSPDASLLERRKSESTGIISRGESWKDNSLGEIKNRGTNPKTTPPWAIRWLAAWDRSYERLRAKAGRTLGTISLTTATGS